MLFRFWNENAYVIKTYDTTKKGSLNELADNTFINFALLTYSLTNNLTRLKRRVELYEKVLDALNLPSMKRGSGIECNESSYAVPICLKTFQRYCGCQGTFDLDSCPYGLTLNNICRSPPVVKCCMESIDSTLDLVGLFILKKLLLDQFYYKYYRLRLF